MKIPVSATLTTSKPSEVGFTLIELLMALLILTVGLLGLLQSVNIAYEHDLRRRLRDEAGAIAEEQLNVMRLHSDLDKLALFTTATRSTGGVGKEFRVSREATAIGGSRKLNVTVRWSFKNMTTIQQIYTIRKL